MGKTLDLLLRRSFKPLRFKALTNLAISRLAVLKNQKQTRCSISRSDIVELLNLGEHERALVRVEHVIKEHNMLDVFVMIEGYCILLSERVEVIEQQKDCPEELKEAISSLMYAASRCGEFPELQEIRKVLTSRYGKEFTRHATELCNNCGVNPKMIQKLSTRQPIIESRMAVLKEIAAEKGISLQLERTSSVAAEEKQPEVLHNQSAGLGNTKNFPENWNKLEGFTNSMNTRHQYNNVADAAREAFLSATYAAAAARAAMELSRSSPRRPDDPNDPNNHGKQVIDTHYDIRSQGETTEGKSLENTKEPIWRSDKVHQVDNYSLDSEDEIETIETEKHETIQAEHTNSRSCVSTISSGALERDKHVPQQVKFEDGDYETECEEHNQASIKDQRAKNTVELPYYSYRHASLSSEASSRIDSENSSAEAETTAKSALRLHIDKKMMSLRTRR